VTIPTILNNSNFGWQKYIDAENNGITFPDILPYLQGK
jgi:hypothetical protein